MITETETRASDTPGHDISLNAFGIPVMVRISGAGADALAEHVLDAWAWCDAARADSEPSGSTVVVRAVLDPDRDVVGAAHESGAVAGQTMLEASGSLTPAVTAAALEAGAGELLMLHAGAVADPATGRTVILVGASGAGKSTASRALGAEFSYVTDETVAFGPDAAPRSFAKPVSLFPEGRSWGKVQHAPQALGMQRAPRHLTVGGVLILHRDPDAVTPAVSEPLPIIQALTMLGEHTSYLTRLSRPLHRMAEVLHAAGGAHLVSYRDATDLLPLVRELLTLQPAPADDTSVPSSQPDSLPFEATESATDDGHSPRVTRTPLTDLFFEDGLAVAFVGGRLVALSEVATAIMALVGDGSPTLSQLTDELVVRFSAPAEHDPHSLTSELCASLVQNGLLTVSRVGDPAPTPVQLSET